MTKESITEWYINESKNKHMHYDGHDIINLLVEFEAYVSETETVDLISDFVNRTLDKMLVSPAQYERERKRMVRQMNKICKSFVKLN